MGALDAVYFLENTFAGVLCRSYSRHISFDDNIQKGTTLYVDRGADRSKVKGVSSPSSYQEVRFACNPEVSRVPDACLSTPFTSRGLAGCESLFYIQPSTPFARVLLCPLVANIALVVMDALLLLITAADDDDDVPSRENNSQSVLSS